MEEDFRTEIVGWQEQEEAVNRLFVMFCNLSSLRVIYRENPLKSEEKKSRKDVWKATHKMYGRLTLKKTFNEDRQSWVFFLPFSSTLPSGHHISSALKNRTIPNERYRTVQGQDEVKPGWVGRSARVMEKIQCRPYSLKNKDSMGMGMKTKKKPKRSKLPDNQLFYKKNTVKT